jgi:hypothetical protein
VAPAVPGHHERGKGKERAEAQVRAGYDDRGGPPGARDEQRPPRNAEQQQPDAAERRAGAAAGTASVADTPTLLGVGTTPSMTRRRIRPAAAAAGLRPRDLGCSGRTCLDGNTTRSTSRCH